jgi:sucrose-6-phosphate hydrolase SacC (GH32 family)
MSMKIFTLLFVLFFASLVPASGKSDKEYYNEKYRPQFHFSPEKNWMNDPNGLVYYDGEYHLFFQHNPKSTKWGYMHWGHAVSKDLIHWEHLPIALYPDDNSVDERHCTEWSGCAIVDENNVAGLQEGTEKTLLAFYTSWECGQRLAYSSDKGRTWKKYSGNPIIPYNDQDDARDPKVFWHNPSGKWVMVLYRRPGGSEEKQGISIYNSDNLFDWEFKSHQKGFHECPDLFEIPVEGEPDRTKWAMLGGNGAYYLGSFDGKEFKPETDLKTLDYGKNFYATQTWTNHPEGKIIQIAWMKGGEYPEMPFNGQMTFPCELSLRNTPDGAMIIRKPIEDIKLLHDKEFHKDNKNLMPGFGKNLLSGVKGKALHIIATFDVKTADSFGFYIRHSRKSTGTEIRYDVKKNLLHCLGGKSYVEPKNGKIKIEMLIDWSSVELFVNEGEVVMSSCFTPDEKADNLLLWNRGGELLVEDISIYELESVWK